MARFDLESYAEVKDRVADFYRDHPEGSIRTFLVKQQEKEVVFEARCYRNPEEAARGIYTSGWAREVEGSTPVNKTSHLENCETSAIGRALANLDYPGSIDGKKAPRPSREEMGKTQRAPEQNGNGANKAPWEKVMPFGKTKGTPLGDHTEEQLRATIDWCREKGKFEDLIADCEATLEAAGATV